MKNMQSFSMNKQSFSMNKTTFLLTLIFVAMIAGLSVIAFIFFYHPELSGKTVSPVADATNEAASAADSPSPTPLLNINSSSNLSDEANKLVVPPFGDDYKALDNSLSQF